MKLTPIESYKSYCKNCGADLDECNSYDEYYCTEECLLNDLFDDGYGQEE